MGEKEREKEGEQQTERESEKEGDKEKVKQRKSEIREERGGGTGMIRNHLSPTSCEEVVPLITL